VSGTVGVNQWQYFNFTTASSFVSVQLLERETRGAMWLFVDVDQNPTLANHDYQDVDFDRPFHAVNFVLPASSSPLPRTVFIGVYGDPIMTGTTPKPFALVAWSPQ
jgi:hypothetical protein